MSDTGARLVALAEVFPRGSSGPDAARAREALKTRADLIAAGYPARMDVQTAAAICDTYGARPGMLWGSRTGDLAVSIGEVARQLVKTARPTDTTPENRTLAA